MAALNEGELQAFVYHAQAQGCNMFRVGAQTDGWAGHPALYLDAAAGPMVFSDEWRDNLARLLDVTARIPDTYLQLIPTFTHKHEGYQRNLRITEEVVAMVLAEGYQHVVWEAFNEYRHPITHDSITTRSVGQLLRYLKTTGLPVGADVSGGRRGKWVGEYPRELLPLVDYVAFHPPRNDWNGNTCVPERPDYWQLRKTVNSYPGKPVWIDEPTCFISDESKARYGITSLHGHYALCGGKTEQARKKHIADYMWDVEHAGGIWFTHASWLFECRYLGWMPN
jgi:hypothetical protein